MGLRDEMQGGNEKRIPPRGRDALRDGVSACWDHAALTGIVEDTSRIDDWADFSEGFETVSDTVRRKCVIVKIHSGNIPRFQDVTETNSRIVRIQFAGCYAVPEEDSGEALRDNGFNASGPHGNGGVFSGGSATKVLPCDHDFIGGLI